MFKTHKQSCFPMTVILFAFFIVSSAVMAQPSVNELNTKLENLQNAEHQLLNLRSTCTQLLKNKSLENKPGFYETLRNTIQWVDANLILIREEVPIVIAQRDRAREWQNTGIMPYNLDGNWFDYTPSTGNKGQISTITQNGNKLTFKNHFGNISHGKFLNQNQVIANDWNGLKGTLIDEGKIIKWDNGSIWQRSKRQNSSGGQVDWLIGSWTYHIPSTGFTDVHTFHSDGTINFSDSYWTFDGGTLTLYWPNKWINRYTTGIGTNSMTGVSISPEGEELKSTLKR